MPETKPTLHLHNARVSPLPEITTDASVTPSPSQESSTKIRVRLECDIDLVLLRKQKHALFGISEGSAATYEQVEVAEDMLDMLDFILDSILEQGLATEDEIFPRLPQLFAAEPATLDAAA
ncbi:hypothetical protein [Edaphobacter dinghuensis]|uniref:Uncharacterized protein n=1 Tax=Edaphobacter dinghuensis TaxID=1560005 RepID=A0A917HQ23_9BACT|nr:hypothetical protein [Edaphobacter dinghuensis]GGG86752.1 hypothetical protein GCM10011585_33380 [Edaphobacter dinghuensis]